MQFSPDWGTFFVYVLCRSRTFSDSTACQQALASVLIGAPPFVLPPQMVLIGSRRNPKMAQFSTLLSGGDISSERARSLTHAASYSILLQGRPNQTNQRNKERRPRCSAPFRASVDVRAGGRPDQAHIHTLRFSLQSIGEEMYSP